MGNCSLQRDPGCDPQARHLQFEGSSDYKGKRKKKGKGVKLQMESIRTLKTVICMRLTNPLPWVQILLLIKHYRSVVVKCLSTSRESVALLPRWHEILSAVFKHHQSSWLLMLNFTKRQCLGQQEQKAELKHKQK